jgi:hypothetical protein
MLFGCTVEVASVTVVAGRCGKRRILMISGGGSAGSNPAGGTQLDQHDASLDQEECGQGALSCVRLCPGRSGACRVSVPKLTARW